VACVHVRDRTAHYISPAMTDPTLGCGRSSGYYGNGATQYGCHFILAQFQFVGASLQAARGQVGIPTVATLEPLVGRAKVIEGQDLNAYADGTSSSPGWVAQKC
jgi:hypothetical protein